MLYMALPCKMTVNVDSQISDALHLLQFLIINRKFDCIGWKIIKFVFLMFRESLLVVSHVVIRLRFSLTDVSNADRLWLVQNRLVSSAKMWKLKYWQQLLKSLMYNRNRRGPIVLISVGHPGVSKQGAARRWRRLLVQIWQKCGGYFSTDD